MVPPQDHGTLYDSGAVGPHQLFEDIGGLPIGELAPEVVVLGHADPGVSELVADLAGGHCGVVEEARDGLAQRVADQPLDTGASQTCRHTRRTFGGSRQPSRESGTRVALLRRWRGGAA